MLRNAMGWGEGESAFPEKKHYEDVRFNVISADMPPGTDCPYPIRILAFFEMIRPYHLVIRI